MELRLILLFCVCSSASARYAFTRGRDLCKLYGGICLTGNCTIRLKHRWEDVSLCPSLKCCQCIRDTCLSIVITSVTSTTVTPFPSRQNVTSHLSNNTATLPPIPLNNTFTNTVLTQTINATQTTGANLTSNAQTVTIEAISVLSTLIKKYTTEVVTRLEHQNTTTYPLYLFNKTKTNVSNNATHTTPLTTSNAYTQNTSNSTETDTSTSVSGNVSTVVTVSNSISTHNISSTKIHTTKPTPLNTKGRTKRTATSTLVLISNSSSSVIPTSVQSKITSSSHPPTTPSSSTTSTSTGQSTTISLTTFSTSSSSTPNRRTTTAEVVPIKFPHKTNEEAEKSNENAAKTIQCGLSPLPHPASRQRVKRIAGGTIARRHNWPWMIAVKYFTGMTVCGGSLISARWVITAAHCCLWDNIMPVRYWRVRIGEYSLSDDDQTEKDLKIKSVFRHPKYRRKKRHHNLYDIALIQLSEDAPMGQPYSDAICLPPQDLAVNYMFNKLSDETIFAADDCWTIGWGITLQTEHKFSLRQVKGTVHVNEVCSKAYGVKLDPTLLCFGNGLTGPCQRDSGGPLMCRKDGHFYLVGITSFGAKRCGSPGYPVVFTRVASFLPWIMDVLQEQTHPSLVYN